MKKIFIIFTVTLLCACSSKTIKWQDVEEKYNEIETNCQSYMADEKTITKQDFTLLINNISDNIEDFQAGIIKDNEEIAQTLYENACKLLNLSSYSNSIYANSLQKFAQNVKDLVISAYDNADNFSELKTQITDQLNKIDTWQDKEWKTIEKYPSVSWSEVETIYQQLEQEVSNELTPRAKVDETELENIKYTIINNYESILSGVKENNQQPAYDIYKAAYKLQAYTQNIDAESAIKVNDFAIHAMEYVQKAYGKQIDDSGYDFLNEIESAKKWPLSLWSELTALMKKYN